MITTNGHNITPGVVLESSRGIYAISASVRIAEDLGFPLDWDESLMLDCYDSGVPMILPGLEGEVSLDDIAGFLLDQGGLADRALDWLNEHTTGGLWYWVDGDFRVDVECPNDWDECSDDECWQHSDY
jgi:hypothetical protein